MIRLRALACTLALISAAPVAAEISLALPLDCELGKTCFIEDYVDHDPEQGRQQDFACGYNSRDGHKGTDVALLSFEAIDQGVAVLASAPGVVLRVRDGMEDDRLMRGVTDKNACGNAAIVEHADGWQTLYCHMRKGSVSVAPGDLVQTGDPLGLVGLSGKTNHPHVHLTVYKDGALVDPFRPDGLNACGDPGPTLWADPIAYTKTGLVTASFSNRVPSMDEVRSGAARRNETSTSEPLVVYAQMAFAQPGDLLTISAIGPDGSQTFLQEVTVETDQVNQMRAMGRKAPAQGWQVGDYQGEALLTRDGVVIAHRFAHVTVRK